MPQDIKMTTLATPDVRDAAGAFSCPTCGLDCASKTGKGAEPVIIGHPTIGLSRVIAQTLRSHHGVQAVVEASRRTGLPDPLSAPADLRIPLAKETAFAQAAAEVSGDIDIGFLGGLSLSIAVGLPGYISSTSQTLGDAFRDAFRFYPLIRPGMTLGLVDLGNAMSLRLTLSDPSLNEFPRHQEATVASIVGQIRAFTARSFYPDALSFQHDRRAAGQAVRTGFGCAVTFGANHTEMLFPREALRREIRGRDDALRAILVHHGELMESQTRALGLSLAERVALFVQECLPKHVPDAEETARALGFSRRTLSRRLRESETSFADILTEVRMRVAARHLHETDLQVAEIAWRLGYSSASAFSAAFRCATGLSPSAFRKAEATLSD
jgi:AraC-like DNA-binding protein